MFEPVSRSEFGDLVGVLEGVGLLSRAGGCAEILAGGGGGRRAIGRSASFAGGTRFGGGVGKGKGKSEVKMAKGVRIDEVLRGLGISPSADAPADIKEEVLRAIWETEKSRLARELKTLAREKEITKLLVNGFEDALKD